MKTTMRLLTLSGLLAVLVPDAAAQQRTESRNSAEVLTSFAGRLQPAVRATVRVLEVEMVTPEVSEEPPSADGAEESSVEGEATDETVRDETGVQPEERTRNAALGLVVDPEAGLILTKASEVEGALRCELSDGRTYDAEVVAVDDAWDLALLKVEAEGLTVAPWNTEPLAPGRFVLTTALEMTPLAFGIISSAPRKIRGAGAFLGVTLGDAPGGALIENVTRDTAASEAGLEGGDLVLSVDEDVVADRESLIRAIGGRDPGDEVVLKVRRGESELTLPATLRARNSNASTGRRSRGGRFDGGASSEVSAGFDAAVQHDTVVRPQDCGGPLVDLNGKVVGLNIARAGRVNTYALPTDIVLERVAAMRETVVGLAVPTEPTATPVVDEKGGESSDG